VLYHEFLAQIEGSNEQIDSNHVVSPLITNYPHIIENVGKCPDPSSIPELCKNRVTYDKSCPRKEQHYTKMRCSEGYSNQEL